MLKTPAEVRNAVRYDLGNIASHAARRGERLSERYVDRFSSASGRGARAPQLSLFETPATSEARTWLLRTAQPVEMGSASRLATGVLGDGRAVGPSQVPQADSDDLVQELDATGVLLVNSSLRVLVRWSSTGSCKMSSLTFVAEEA